jgi:hypothetical protein
VTLPNQIPFSYQVNENQPAVPLDQGSANLLAVGTAVEVLLSCVIRQGTSASPTFAHGEYIAKPALGETGWLDANHPFFLGAYGAIPLNGTDREPAIAAASNP